VLHTLPISSYYHTYIHTTSCSHEYNQTWNTRQWIRLKLKDLTASSFLCPRNGVQRGPLFGNLTASGPSSNFERGAVEASSKRNLRASAFIVSSRRRPIQCLHRIK
jgi:hypothetical protein